MKIIYIDGTVNPEKLIEVAAKLCYDKDGDIENMLQVPINYEFIEMLNEMEHDSPFEHAVMSFGIDGVSRTLLAQLSRHRIASLSVRSQRYVNHENFEYITPDIINKYPEVKQHYDHIMFKINQNYKILNDLLLYAINNDDEYKKMKNKKKFVQEEARYVLPNATETKFIWTINVRSLWNFLKERMCNRAQAEIRTFAWNIFEIVAVKYPSLFINAGPKCITGRCKQGKMSCSDPAGIKELHQTVINTAKYSE